MKNTRENLLRFILICLSLVGCTVPSSPPQNQCVPDLTCWYGIKSGVTTLTDANELLKNRYNINNLIIGARNIYWQGNMTDTYETIVLHFDDHELITEVEVSFFQNQLTVSDMIESIGVPLEVHIVPAISSETKCAGAYIVYPSKGVIAHLSHEGDFVGVKPSQSVSPLDLLPPEQLQISAPLDVIKFEWKGFMNYCELSH